MTGAEFFDRLYANGAFIDDSGAASRVIIREFDAAVAALTAERDAVSARAAVLYRFAQSVTSREGSIAQMTERAQALVDEGPVEIGERIIAERDAALEDAAFKELQRDEARGEHCSCCDAARTERDAANRKFEDTWKELQAARADAAVMRAELQVAAEHACETPCRDRAESDCDKCGNHDSGYRCHFCKAKQALGGDAGRDLLAEVARLREEHVAYVKRKEALDAYAAAPTSSRKIMHLIGDMETTRDAHEVAHAAVEALRTVKP